MVAGQEDLEVAAVVCLGYPLKVPVYNTLLLIVILNFIVFVFLGMILHKHRNCSV